MSFPSSIWGGLLRCLIFAFARRHRCSQGPASRRSSNLQSCFLGPAIKLEQYEAAEGSGENASALTTAMKASNTDDEQTSGHISVLDSSEIWLFPQAQQFEVHFVDLSLST